MTQKSNTVRLMLTGGHMTPAIAMIEVIRDRHPEWSIVFVGRKHALEGESALSEEYTSVNALNVPFFPLIAGRIRRDMSILSVWSLFKVPIGFIQAVGYVLKTRPTVIVSFGGYIAFPVVIAAVLFGVPVVTHEQTAAPGLANRIIARLARTTAVSFPLVGEMLGGRTVVTGLPVRKAISELSTNASFPVPKNLPVIAVVGGSTGSVSINTVVFSVLPTLLKDFAVVHQVGRISLAKALEVKRVLPTVIRDRYVPLPYIEAGAYAWLLRQAEVIIGRSGANTVTEAAMTGSIGIWIPLPWAAGNEQFHNAEVLKHAGSSIILLQKNLTPRSLDEAVKIVTKNRAAMKQSAERLSKTFPTDGADRFLDVIEDAVRAAHPS